MLGRSRRSQPGSVPRAVERLEPRQYLAASLPEGFEETRVVTGLDEVTSMDFAPDGRLFVTELDGRVRVVKNGQKLSTPFLSLKVDRYNNRGLIGLTFDPNFSSNRYVYVFYSKADPDEPNVVDNDSVNRISRFRASGSNPDVVESGSEVVLLDNIPNDLGGHNGGAMHFGPDGMLYVTTGETGIGAYAQNLNSLAGKILRLNVRNHPGSIIPGDNPFVGQSGKRPEIWAYGLRHPYTAAIHPETGRYFVNDVGASDWEEINEVKKGRNFGWNKAEGNSSNGAYTNPLYTYGHNGSGAAIVGGTFYTGEAFPDAYHDQYFFADFEDDWVKVLDPATKKVSTFATGLRAPIDLDVGPDGALYYLAYNDRYSTKADRSVYKFEYVGDGNRPPTAEFTVDKTSGTAPMVVAFDGSASSDPDGEALTYKWDFGDGTTSSLPVVQHIYQTPGRYVATLTVTDARGLSHSEKSPTIDANNAPPTGTITLPPGGTTYRAGDTIHFAGGGADPEDGTLDGSTFAWSVRLFHNEHSHPFLEFEAVAAGSFKIPNPPDEVETDQFYRIRLEVTDSGGATHSTFVDVTPLTSTVALDASVPGLSLELDGLTVPAGHAFLGVENAIRTLGAPPTQTVGDVTYDFIAWSDGGAATHEIFTPAEDTTYTAVYHPRGVAHPQPAPDPTPTPTPPVDPPAEPPPPQQDPEPRPTAPRLTIDAVEAPPAAVVGQAGNAVIRVGNRGSDTFKGPVRVELLLSADATADDGDMPASGATAKLNLRPGASKAVKVKFACPPTPADGSYFLLARVHPLTVGDAGGDPTPSGAGASARPVAVRHRVIDLSASLALGGRNSASARILNGGTESATGPLTLRLLAVPIIDGAPAADVPPIELSTVTRPVTISPGRAKPVRLSFGHAASLRPGTYELRLEVDAGGAFAERNEDNNSAISAARLVMA